MMLPKVIMDTAAGLDGTAKLTGTNTTEYSRTFASVSDKMSFQIFLTQTLATFTATVTLWVSNVENPDLANDNDWVQLTATHGWAGFPAEPFSGTEKDYIDVQDMIGHLYRFKVVQTGGEGECKILFDTKAAD